MKPAFIQAEHGGGRIRPLQPFLDDPEIEEI